jgi:hypothetical protein
MLKGIKLFDLMDDRIEVVKRNNDKILIPFSDIEVIRFIAAVKPKSLIAKILNITNVQYKEFNQNSTMKEYQKLTDFQSLKKNTQYMPYEIGWTDRWTDKGIQIYIFRKSGIGWLKLLLPWKHNLEKSRSYVLRPSDPWEFSEQLYIAYEKWKRSNPPPTLTDEGPEKMLT